MLPEQWFNNRKRNADKKDAQNVLFMTIRRQRGKKYQYRLFFWITKMNLVLPKIEYSSERALNFFQSSSFCFRNPYSYKCSWYCTHHHVNCKCSCSTSPCLDDKTKPPNSLYVGKIPFLDPVLCNLLGTFSAYYA